jgi:hypothetical protein
VTYPIFATGRNAAGFWSPWKDEMTPPRDGAEGRSAGSVAEGQVGKAGRRIADVGRAQGTFLDLTGLGLTTVPDLIGHLTALDLAGNRHLLSPC